MNVTLSVRALPDNTCSTYTTAWEALIPWLAQCAQSVETVQERIPLFSFAHFEGGIKKQHVRAVTAVMLDYDGTTHEDFIKVVTAAQQYKGFAYTTYNHTLKGEPPCRFRVCIAIDRPVPPSAWELVWHRVGRRIGVISDKAPDRKTRDEGRFFFQPAQNPNGPPCWFTAWDGPPLSLDELLAPDPNEPAIPMIIESELEQAELVNLFDLNQLAKKLCTKKSSEHQMLGRALSAALRGEVFAAEHHRNDMAFKLAGELAKAFPKGDAHEIAERFRSAFELQGEPTVETFAGQIKRQQLKYQQMQREKRTISHLKTGMTASEALAVHEAPAKAIIAGLPLIVQKDGFYWCREPDSPDYNEVYGMKDIRLAIMRKYHDTIDQYDGEGQPIGLDKLILTYSHVVRHVEANYTAEQTTYESKRARLTLATAPRRPLVPEYNADVAQWLNLLGGRRVEEVLAWIRSIFTLHQPAPALYLWGGSGAGKTLLPFGLASLWENPLTSFANCIDSFNGGLARNPLVLADEGFPSETKFTWLRSFLSTSERDVNEKYRPMYTLRGHVRLAVTANNPSAFEFGRRALTSEDAKAIAERVIQIEVGEEAISFLRYVSSRTDIDTEWVKNGAIAKHALWLAQQPYERPAGRWAVVSSEGTSGFEEHLVADRYAWFVAWLGRYLAIPQATEKRWYSNGNSDGWLVRTEGDKLLVSADAYRYVNEGKCEPSEFKKALKFFAPGERIRLRVPGNSERLVSYRAINIDRFYACAKDYVDLDTLLTTLGTDTRVRMGM